MYQIKELLPVGSLARPGKKLDTIQSITIHWVGPYPGQSVYAPYYWWRDGPDGKGITASAHFIIKDDTCLQAIPINEVAWHCGNALGNNTSIGIEVIPVDTSGKFSVLSIETLKEVLASLPKVPLKRHYDWTGKDCPRYYILDERWDTLRRQLDG
jgi:N-acetylmuramoyl-L-alanine amidase